MTFLRFRLTCNCNKEGNIGGTEMFLAENDITWVFECPKCGVQVSVEDWTPTETEEEEKQK